jgi:tetratricopeptide (TPR) repeat protein
VAETIERLYADRLDDQTELLANHYRWSPHLDRAVHYLILAGQKASRSNVNQQARLHYETALELLYQIDYTPDQAFQVHSGLGDCLVFAGEYPEARGHYEWALQSLDSRQARERSATQRNLARTFERQGDYERALEHLSLAEQCLKEAGARDPVELARVWNDTAWIKFRRGGVSEAEELLGRALELVEGASSYDVVASIYNRLGGLAYTRGDWEQAARYLRKSIAIREETRDVVNLSTSLNNLGLLEIEMGKFDSALENLSRSYELKQRLGQAEGIAMALNNLGWLRILRGELETARSVLQQALDLAQQIGYSSLHQQIMRSFGELYLASQDWGAALMLLNENLSALESQGSSDELVDCYRQLGEAALGAGDLIKALTWAQKAGDLLDAVQKGSRGQAALKRGEYLLFRGALATRMGDLSSAAAYLQESRSLFESLNSRLHLARTLQASGALALAQTQPEYAHQHFIKAAQIFSEIGATLDAGRAQEAAVAIECSSQP